MFADDGAWTKEDSGGMPAESGEDEGPLVRVSFGFGRELAVLLESSDGSTVR